MQPLCEKHRPSASREKFWDNMASGYPLPLDEKTSSETSRTMDLVKAMGVEFRGKDILDIGCGTGVHALPFAREARWVTGLDASSAMIEVMAKEISRHGLQNVRAVCSDWRSVDISAAGYTGAFDIAWTSMSPAVRTREDLLKMEACSTHWCVYIGWGGKRKNALIEVAFTLHGLKFGPPPGISAIREILSDRGKRFSIDFFETSWDWAGTPEAAVEELAGFIEMAGCSPDRNTLYELLPDWEKEGIIRHTTEVEEGIVVWET